MSITQTITPAPAAPQRREPSTFADKADAFVAWQEDNPTELNTWAGQVNMVADNVNTNATDAANEAAAAQSSAGTAQDWANTAQDWAEQTINGERFTATSSTSVEIATGIKTFTLNESYRSFTTGMQLRIVDTSNPVTNYMEGVVTNYDDSADELVVNISDKNGTGTIAAWSLGVNHGGDASTLNGYTVLDLFPVKQPAITSPTQNEADFKGTFETDTYSTRDNFTGTQDVAHWQISYTVDFAIIEHESTTGNLTDWTYSLGEPLQTAYVRMRKGSDGHLSAWSSEIKFTTSNVYIETPTITVEDSPSDVPESPLLTGSTFIVFGGSDTHNSTDWQVYEGATLVWESLANTSDLLTINVPTGQLSVNTEYTFKVRYNGNTYGFSGYGETTATTASIFNATYGLNWDETNDTYTRTGDASSWATPSDFTDNKTVQAEMKRCVLNTNGSVNYFLYPTDSTLKADGVTASVLDGTDGNVMVQIPKFYYKYNYNTTTGVVHEHTISLSPFTGGTVHPAFVQNGVEKDYRYYPAYQGSVVGGKLVSISGAYVDCDYTRDQFRTYAEANGAGWHVTDWLLYEAVVLLMVTEYGTMNMQSALGEGRVRLSGGTWVDGSYYGIHGNSNSDGNFSNNNTYIGDADDAAADLSYMTYRGCENVWGNVYLFLDGININEHMVYLNDNPATFADDTVTNYTDIGVIMGSANGYVVKLANSSKGFFPTDVTGGTDSTGTTDYYTQSTGWRIAYAGGHAISGLFAGPLSLRANYDSAYLTVSISAGVSF